MATLSQADKQNLNADQQKQVLALKEQYETAKASGATQAELDKIHTDAENIRASAASGAYSGGAAGNQYVEKPAASTANTNNAYATNVYATGSNSGNSSNTKLSQADSALLNAEQQAQIAALKQQYATAQAGGASGEELEAIHQQAEAIRQSAGYTGGTTGADYSILGANAGGMTADQMKQWLEDYMYTNYKTGTGWTNGYSTAVNTRSKANKIRQQMLANEQSMANADAATKRYLHEQNLALAQLLYDYTGQSERNTWYNEELGRWETWNDDVGYGYNVSWDQPNIYNAHVNYLGYTDADIDKYRQDTGLYYNFVDPRTIRLATDESSGYTGVYSQFVNGPYLQLLGGGTHDGSVNQAIYQNMPNDGFEDNAMTGFTPIRDENGNVINTTAPMLKNNNAMTDYTNQFTSYAMGGVIQPGILAATHPGGGSSHGGVQKGSNNGTYSYSPGYGVDGSDPRYTGGINRDVAASTPEDPNNIAGQLAYYNNYAVNATSPRYGGGSLSHSSGGSGSGGYDDYINQMYAAALESQMAQLESSYKENLSGLDTAVGKVDDTYTEQKRQTTGTNAQQAAAWREMANAYGLNSGAIGQAALAQNNQLQSNLNTLESAQAAALTEIEQQRNLLGQQYQLAINQALAENNFNKADALYQEAVRQDELMLQKQQMAIQTALQVAQMAMQQSQFEQSLALDYAKAAGSASRSGGGSGGVGDGSNLYIDAGGGIPALGTDDYYDYIQSAADAAGQSGGDYIVENYKALGIPYSNITGRVNDYNGYLTKKDNYGDLEQRLGLLAGLNREQKYSVIEEAVMSGQITDTQGKALAELYGYL